MCSNVQTIVVLKRVLQCVAVCCSVLQLKLFSDVQTIVGFCNTLQHTATSHKPQSCSPYESCPTYEWVMSHIWKSHVSHICMSHVPHINGSCITYEWVMSHVWMSHVTRMNESCWLWPPPIKWVLSRVWMSHVDFWDMAQPQRWWPPRAAAAGNSDESQHMCAHMTFHISRMYSTHVTFSRVSAQVCSLGLSPATIVCLAYTHLLPQLRLNILCFVLFLEQPTLHNDDDAERQHNFVEICNFLCLNLVSRFSGLISRWMSVTLLQGVAHNFPQLLVRKRKGKLNLQVKFGKDLKEIWQFTNSRCRSASESVFARFLWHFSGGVILLNPWF